MEYLIVIPIIWYLSKNTFPRLSNLCGTISLLGVTGILIIALFY